jgi:hypothetical protein
MTWNLINRPFELLNGIVLRFALRQNTADPAPAIGVGEPPSDLMTQGAVNALRIGAPLSTFAVTFQ